jgi:hypothetical protein
MNHIDNMQNNHLILYLEQSEDFNVFSLEIHFYLQYFTKYCIFNGGGGVS